MKGHWELPEPKGGTPLRAALLNKCDHAGPASSAYSGLESFSASWSSAACSFCLSSASPVLTSGSARRRLGSTTFSTYSLAFSIAESIFPSTSSTSAGRATASILSGWVSVPIMVTSCPRTVCRKQSVQARGGSGKICSRIIASCSVSPTSSSSLPTLDILHFSDIASPFCDFLLWMGVYWSIQPAPARPEGIYPRTPCGPVEQAATVRQRKSVPSPAHRGRSDRQTHLHFGVS